MTIKAGTVIAVKFFGGFVFHRNGTTEIDKRFGRREIDGGFFVGISSVKAFKGLDGFGFSIHRLFKDFIMRGINVGANK